MASPLTINIPLAHFAVIEVNGAVQIDIHVAEMGIGGRDLQILVNLTPHEAGMIAGCLLTEAGLTEPPPETISWRPYAKN